RPIDHVAGYTGWIAHILLAHRGLDAVRTNQGAARKAASVISMCRDRVARLRDVGDAGAGDGFDCTFLARALEQADMDVRSMDDGIGIAEALAKRFSGGDAPNEVLIERIVHH